VRKAATGGERKFIEALKVEEAERRAERRAERSAQRVLEKKSGVRISGVRISGAGSEDSTHTDLLEPLPPEPYTRGGGL
jgi:hypothetical protein